MANGRFILGKQSGGTLGLVFPDGISNTEVMLPESGNLVSVDTTVTDNSIARYDGTTGKLHGSGVIVDDNGNVGIGMTPSAWRTQQKVIEIDGSVALSNFNGLANVTLSTNMYIDSSNQFLYKNNGYASYYSQSNSIHEWYIAPSGIAGNVITFTNALNLDASGNLLLKSPTGVLGYGTGAGGQVTQLTSKSTSVTLNKPCGRIIMNNEALAAGASAIFSVNNSLVTNRDLIYCFIDDSRVGNVYSVLPWYVTEGMFYLQVKNNGSITYSDTVGLKFVVIKGSTN